MIGGTNEFVILTAELLLTERATMLYPYKHVIVNIDVGHDTYSISHSCRIVANSVALTELLRYVCKYEYTHLYLFT